MAGLVPHVLVGLILAFLVYWKFRHRDFSIAIFTGNLLHDIFGFTYIPFVIGTLDPYKIIESAMFSNRDSVFLLLWLLIQSIFILFFIFFRKLLRKKEYKELEYNIAFLLLGIIIHTIMDIFIIEQGIFF